MNTAVEWLVDQLTVIGQLEIPKGSNVVTSIINEAKLIEKNQIVLAFINGDNSDCLEEEDSLLYALAYYNEKFKK
jgi:hypothetical protein